MSCEIEVSCGDYLQGYLSAIAAVYALIVDVFNQPVSEDLHCAKVHFQTSYELSPYIANRLAMMRYDALAQSFYDLSKLIRIYTNQSCLRLSDGKLEKRTKILLSSQNMFVIWAVCLYVLENFIQAHSYVDCFADLLFRKGRNLDQAIALLQVDQKKYIVPRSLKQFWKFLEYHGLCPFGLRPHD